LAPPQDSDAISILLGARINLVGRGGGPVNTPHFMNVYLDSFGSPRKFPLFFCDDFPSVPSKRIEK
jgi:hypothetical protein